MAKPLTFNLGGNEYSLEPVRLDRKKLYGWTEKLVLDTEGSPCVAASLDETGTLLIPKGGSGIGIWDEKGHWLDRAQLIPTRPDGKVAKKIPSSFAATIELKETVTLEEFLDHKITAIYTMQGEENCPDFVKAVSKSIYTFQFNYREGYQENPAFIMESQGELFVLIGQKMQFEFVGLERAGLIDETEEDALEQEEEESMDFSMM